MTMKFNAVTFNSHCHSPDRASRPAIKLRVTPIVGDAFVIAGRDRQSQKFDSTRFARLVCDRAD